MTTPNDATMAQVIAADPGRSTWLSANAGSGKTRVLTDRVARLLLKGVDPQKILCLTYTKAAASEMQNRLFARLGSWSMKPDDDLRTVLAELGASTDLDGSALSQARRLFAAAIETPGGLKIQTIHSFCASILRRFPLEAGVSPRFAEIDDRSARLLRAEVLETVAEGEHQVVLDDLAAWLSTDDFDGLLAQLGSASFQAHSGDQLLEALEMPSRPDDAEILAQAFPKGCARLVADISLALTEGTVTDQKLLSALTKSTPENPSMAGVKYLESALLFGGSAASPFGSKAGKLPTKATRAAIGAHADALDTWCDAIESARLKRIAKSNFDRSLALNAFGAVFQKAYADAKAFRGLLDFDDLILKTRALLENPQVAQWVLYRLDGGIDHVLVDEAQDTSPEQWDVIAAITQEFTSGFGARDVARTIFVVGDKKQSIYSFQGADPANFDHMRDDFSDRLRALDDRLEDRQLIYSFRSAPAILQAVDIALAGLPGVGDATHAAFQTVMPGRVDLWPMVAAPDKPEPGDWFDPVDRISADDPSVVLADAIASEIRRLLDTGLTLPGKGEAEPRAATEGDFLILVQRRGPLFHEIIRACKAAGLNVAGADVLKVGGELAVKDLTALLSFVALPEDDLSLAATLRSPLFGWDEQDLFDLAHRRDPGTFLWTALRQRKDEFPGTIAILQDLRDNVDFLRPFDMIERILTQHRGRTRFLAQLGEEAEDGIDALVGQAILYEQTEVPSLTGFLAWLAADELKIKRQTDSAGDRLRVMTVHGAKGLEAPIVILPDTAKRPHRSRGEIVQVSDCPVWRPPATDRSGAIGDAIQAEDQRQAEERERLLYVAMTRAENWLIVCGAGEAGHGSESWHSQVAQGMITLEARNMDFPTGSGFRHELYRWPASADIKPALAEHEAPAAPEWLAQPVPAAAQQPKPLSPSDLGGAKVIWKPGHVADTEDDAKRRGILVHTLLEHLPGANPNEFASMAGAILSRVTDRVSTEELASVLAEAAACLTSLTLEYLFSPDALSEVEITVELDELDGRRILGAIDRLVIDDQRALVVDFKSNAVVPDAPADVPEGILRQMGAYAAAIAQIYPDKRVEVAVLWTKTASLMPLPHGLVIDALKRASDA